MATIKAKSRVPILPAQAAVARVYHGRSLASEPVILITESLMDAKNDNSNLDVVAPEFAEHDAPDRPAAQSPDPQLG